MNDLVIFDLETSGLPESELRQTIEPFPVFDPTSVKYGNLKPENRPAKLEEKRLAHVDEEAAYWRDKVDRAALSAMTGSVLAIGYHRQPLDNESLTSISAVSEVNSEADVIRHFFSVVTDSGMGAHYKLCGFNITEFDLPFIIRRAWVLGIPVPQGLTPAGTRFYWPNWFIDLRNVWTFCSYGSSELRHGKLGQITRLMGLGDKAGSGADFAKLWRNPETREQAATYLRTDLLLTRRLAERLLPSFPSTSEPFST